MRIVQARPAPAPARNVQVALERWITKTILTPEAMAWWTDFYEEPDWVDLADWQQSMLHDEICTHYAASTNSDSQPIITLNMQNLIELRNKGKQGWGTSWMDEFLNPLGWYFGGVFGSTGYIYPIRGKQVKVPQFLYHFSAAKNEDRIKRRGLIPARRDDKHQDARFMYPPRVFALTTDDQRLVDDLAAQLIGADGEYVLFRINTSKLRHGTKFYEDSHADHAVWTYTHIPPEALEVERHGKT